MVPPRTCEPEHRLYYTTHCHCCVDANWVWLGKKPGHQALQTAQRQASSFSGWLSYLCGRAAAMCAGRFSSVQWTTPDMIPVHLPIISRSHEAAEQAGNEVAGHRDGSAGAKFMPGSVRLIIIATPARYSTRGVALAMTWQCHLVGLNS